MELKETKKSLKLITILLLLVSKSRQKNCKSNCYQCSPNLGICSKCREGYYWDPTLIMCRFLAEAKPGCKFQRTMSTCQQCNEGFVLNQNQCIKCAVTNCLDCSEGSNICKKCLAGYTSTTTSNQNSNCGLRCGVTNCDTCTPGNANSCLKCLDGYRLVNPTTCERCTDQNCLDCSDSVNVCKIKAPLKSCKNGFYWDGSKCVVCGNNCVECDFRGVCLGCDSTRGYYMKEDSRCHTGYRERIFYGLGAWILVFCLGWVG